MYHCSRVPWNTLDCCGRCLGGFTVICFFIYCSGLFGERRNRGELQALGWLVVMCRVAHHTRQGLWEVLKSLHLRKPSISMIALIYYYYYHCYYYYCSFIWLKAEVVDFVEITVDTTTDFVSGSEAFVPGICNYEAHPCFKSQAFFLTPGTISCFPCSIQPSFKVFLSYPYLHYKNRCWKLRNVHFTAILDLIVAAPDPFNTWDWTTNIQ